MKHFLVSVEAGPNSDAEQVQHALVTGFAEFGDFPGIAVRPATRWDAASELVEVFVVERTAE